MSFFTTWATKPKVKKKAKTKKKTPQEMMDAQADDQIAMLGGAEIKTADGKNLKKSWWDQKTKIVDVRIGVMPLNNTDNDIIAQTKEDYQSILQALKNWEQDPELKKRVMEVHEVLTKPKEKKKNEA